MTERIAPPVESENPALAPRPASPGLPSAGEAQEVPLSERRGFRLRRLTAFADIAALAITGAITLGLLMLLSRPIRDVDLIVFASMLPVWPVVAITMRLYHPQTVGHGLSVGITDEFAPIFRAVTIWSWAFIVTRSLTSLDPIQLAPSLLVWALAIPTVLFARSAVRSIARRRGWYRQRALVVGKWRDAEKIVTRIERHPEWGLEVARELDVDRGPAPTQVGPDDLVNLARELGVSRVIFATPPRQLDACTDLTRALIEAGNHVDLVPGEAEILRSGASLSDLEGLPLMSMPGATPPRSWSALKRLMDLSIALPALVITSPLIAFAAWRIKRDSEGPVLFQQARAGLNGRPFHLLKLRTMVVDADERREEVAGLSLHNNGVDEGIFKAAGDPRITKVGGWLRRLSLDELPQLWNVARGDMSLIGPRPLPLSEDERVAGHYEMRRQVRPGITGLWQVNGRSDIPFHDMLRLDYSYVLNWSLAGDLKILLQTVDTVARGRGAY